MLTKFKKSILIVCLFMSLILSTLACVTSADPNRTSIKGLDITLEVNQLEEFRAQLRKFANKHSLEYTEQFYNADKTFFSAVMDGDDFVMVLNNSTDSPGTVGIGLFNRASPPIPQETIDELVNDLKSFIVEIPNVKITERVKSLKIRIDEAQREKISVELFAQLQRLADKHSLAYKVATYDSYWGSFLVDMQGEGFRITVEAVRNITGEINLIFYIDFDNNVVPSITPTPQETLDELVDDLKAFLSEIPNVTVTELP